MDFCTLIIKDRYISVRLPLHNNYAGHLALLGAQIGFFAGSKKVARQSIEI